MNISLTNKNILFFSWAQYFIFMNYQKILKITKPSIYFVLGGPGSGKGT